MQLKNLVVLASGLATIANAGIVLDDSLLATIANAGTAPLDHVVDTVTKMPLKLVDLSNNAPNVKPTEPQCTEAELE
ncbi:hypothetical protein C0992_008288, partial [Termitomyces sp. T32_za158]